MDVHSTTLQKFLNLISAQLAIAQNLCPQPRADIFA